MALRRLRRPLHLRPRLTQAAHPERARRPHLPVQHAHTRLRRPFVRQCYWTRRFVCSLCSCSHFSSDACSSGFQSLDNDTVRHDIFFLPSAMFLYIYLVTSFIFVYSRMGTDPGKKTRKPHGCLCRIALGLGPDARGCGHHVMSCHVWCLVTDATKSIRTYT